MGLRKIFLFIIATFLASNLWAECADGYTDHIDATQYLKDFKLDVESGILTFKDEFYPDVNYKRYYALRCYKRHKQDLENGCRFYEHVLGYYSYTEGNSGQVISAQRSYSGEKKDGITTINISYSLQKCMVEGTDDIFICFEPYYYVKSEQHWYYENEDPERQKNLYLINSFVTKLPYKPIYRFEVPEMTKYGHTFTMLREIKAKTAINYRVQMSEDGKQWNTYDAGHISKADAVNGVSQKYEVPFTQNGIDSVMYYRMICTDVEMQTSDTTEMKKIKFYYPLSFDWLPNPTLASAGTKVLIGSLSDCKQFFFTSDFPYKAKEENGIVYITMPKCPVSVTRGDLSYTVNFYNADHTLLKTAEVVCGGDATDLAPANPTYGNYTFTGWSKDLTNVHSNLSVVARYDIGNSYWLDASVTDHENKVFPAQGFAKSVTRAMVGDVVTFTADVFAATNATLYYEKAMWNESEQRYIWLKNSLIWVADYKQPNKECYFDQKVTVAYDANTSYIHPFEHKMAVRFILSVAGVQVYSDPVEIDIYYPLSFTPEYGGLYVENAAGDWSSNIGFIPARSNDTVWVYSSEAADGDGGCLSFGRMLYPNRSLNSGIDANGTAFVLCPGEQETVTVGVTQKLVVFDGVYGNGYPQKLDFTAEGFTKINGYYGEVVHCGGSVTIPEDPEMEGYLFKGWRAWSSDYADDAYLHVPAGSDDVIGFTADWEELPDVPYFIVRFYGKGGSPLLDTQIVLEGENATPPEAPEVSGFHFVGWDKSYVTVAEDLNITALYGDDSKSWTVTYTNWDDTPLGTEQVYDGEAAQGVPATREGYDFAEWVDATTEQPVNMQHIFADITVKAAFVEAVYTITYVMKLDGENMYEMGKENVKHGDMPVLWSELETLAKTDMEEELGDGEEFSGYEITNLSWSPEITAATQDATYEMLYTWAPRKYTVIFQDWDHTILSTQEVEYGGTAQEPAEPKRDGYIFLDWDGSTTGITSDRTLTAKYYKVDKSGFCGPKLEWVFDEETGVLSITGEGEMFDYEVVEEKIELMAPWHLFAAKEQLLQVELPEGMTTVGDVAFALCSFTSLTLPSSVTRIGKMAFAYCEYLEKIVLPAGLTTIGDYALGGTALKEVHNNAATPQVINSTVFMEVNISQCKLYVPAASVEAYKAAEVWKEFLIEAAPEEQPTGLDDVQSDHVQCTKVLRDGVLYIMHNDTLYNVQGQRVK